MKNPFDQFDAPAQNRNPFDQFDAAAPSTLDQVGHQIGLTGRYLAEGAGTLPLMVGDAANAAVNYGIRGVNKVADSNIPELAPVSYSFSKALTDLGAPNPQNSTERVVGDMSRALAGAGTGIGTGGWVSTIADESAPYLKQLGNMLASNPSAQGASAAIGSGAGSELRENGASPKAQLIGSLLAGSIPSAISGTPNVIRSAMQGGKEGAANVQNAIDDFAAAGTTPTVGQATNSPIAKFAESTLAKIPGGDAPIAAKAVAQQQEIGDKMAALSQALSPKASGTKTGRLITSGINDFRDKFNGKQDDLYDKLGGFIAPDVPTPIPNAQASLEKSIAEIPGAPQTSQFFINPKLKALAEALNSDTSAGMPIKLFNDAENLHPYDATFNPGGTQSINIPGTTTGGGTIPYQAVAGVRSMVGKQLTDNPLVADVPRSEYKSLYAGLSADMKNQAAATSPEATQAWNRANNYTRAGMRRIDTLNDIINSGTPEQVYQASLSGTEEGATTLNQVMRSLPTEGKQALTATVVKRMGLATPGNQSDLGENFSTSTFLTNWNKLSPEAKQTLFGAHGADFSKNMDQVARVADNLKNGSKIYANPSGTGHATSSIGAMGASIFHPVGVALGVIGGNKAAKFMTNPDTVKWLAQTTNKPTGALPSQINNLMQWAIKNNDQDTLEAAKQMQNATDGGNSQANPERNN